MALSCHGLREYVSYLEISGNMRKRYNTSVQSFPNRMTVYFNMLCMLMVNRISSYLNGTSIINVKRSRIRLRKNQAQPEAHEARQSQKVAYIAQYSDSVKDLETRACFLLFQEIKESPRNMHQPVTDRRISGHLAQSASL